MSELSVFKDERDGFDVVVVRGKLDETTIAELDAALDGWTNGRPVLVDLGGLESISSAGIRVLLKDRHSQIALVSLPPDIAHLFEGRGLPIFPDVEIAIQSLTLSRGA